MKILPVYMNTFIITPCFNLHLNYSDLETEKSRQNKTHEQRHLNETFSLAALIEAFLTAITASSLTVSTDWQSNKHGRITVALRLLFSKVNWVQRRKTKCQRETGWSLSGCVWTLRRSFIQYVGAFRKQRASALGAFPIFFLTRRVWTHSCQMLLGRGHLFNTLGSWLWPCCGQRGWGYQPCAHC